MDKNLKFNLDTEIVFNVGYPMSATNAPRVYNKLFEELNMNTIMLPIEVKQDELNDFWKACQTLGIRYLSPTMPLKADFVKLLDEVDDISRILDSVNAIKIDKDGKSIGCGLDGKGAINAILESGINLKDKKVMMIGSGSISGLIGFELAQQGVSQLVILNKTIELAYEKADLLNKHTKMKTEVLSLTNENLDEASKEVDLVINSTPLGMKNFGFNHDYLGFMDNLSKDVVVFDVVINPVKTEFLKKAEECGLKTVYGMKMLIGQMEEIFKFLFDVTIEEQHKKAAIQDLCHYLGVDVPID